jgi:hypothetical protein
MTVSIVLEFAVVLAAIWMGARTRRLGLGLWGAVGLLVLVVVFGVPPTSPPIDVMLIILAVIMAASVMAAAGGIDFLVSVAERVIRANPKYVTIHEGLSWRGSDVRRPRPCEGRRQHPRWRGDALGDPAPGAWQEPGSRALRLLRGCLQPAPADGARPEVRITR